jgi:GNAT superfamily N-acetyltransferase
MLIRDALPEDAEAACLVVRRSITELCQADHRNDPEIVAGWLANKTSENVRAWIDQIDSSLLVAIASGRIAGVGSVTDVGRIGLNYVSPDARFRGVSLALLRALEERSREHGNSRCTLTSTETARQFYLSNGYIQTAAPVREFGTMTGYPMSKNL